MKNAWAIGIKKGTRVQHLMRHFARKWKVAIARIQVTSEGRTIYAEDKIEEDMACVIRVARPSSPSGSTGSPSPARAHASVEPLVAPQICPRVLARHLPPHHEQGEVVVARSVTPTEPFVNEHETEPQHENGPMGANQEGQNSQCEMKTEQEDEK